MVDFTRFFLRVAYGPEMPDISTGEGVAMMTFDITHDLNEAMRDVDDFFWNQIPFALSGAMNDTMFDVRKRIVERTYPAAFEVRNKAFPGRLWRVTKRATKGDLETLLTQTLDRGYIEDHVFGGTKRPTGNTIAVPNQGGLRTATGRIRAAKKPLRITNAKNTFLMTGKGGEKRFIMQRKGKELEKVYTFAKQATIKKRFMFYEDAFDETELVFSGHLNDRMSRAIATSRFFPR